MIPQKKKSGWSIPDISYQVSGTDLDVSALGAAVPRNIDTTFTEGAGVIETDVDLDIKPSANYRKSRKSKKVNRKKTK